MIKKQTKQILLEITQDFLNNSFKNVYRKILFPEMFHHDESIMKDIHFCIIRNNLEICIEKLKFLSFFKKQIMYPFCKL